MYKIVMTDKGHTVVDANGRHVFWSRSLSEARFVLAWAQKEEKLGRAAEWSDV